MAQRVTLDDIAREAGVSKNTVSVVLRGKSGVGQAMRDKILELAEKMQYSRQPQAGTVRKYLLVLFDSSIGSYVKNSYDMGLIPRLWFQLQTKAQQLGCMVMPYMLSHSMIENGVLPEPLADLGFASIVSFGRVEASYLNLLHSKGYHVVTIHEYADGVPVDSVTSNDSYAGYVMTEHLISMGHTDIEFMGEKYYMAKYMDRWFGYCRAMAEHGLPIKSNTYSEARVTFQTDEGERARLSEALGKMDRLPTGIVCGEDFTAMRIRRCLEPMGIRCPEDISLVGFDDVYPSNNEECITTFRADHEAIIDSVMNLVLHPEHKPERVVVFGQPVYRNSVKKIER